MRKPLFWHRPPPRSAFMIFKGVTKREQMLPIGMLTIAKFVDRVEKSKHGFRVCGHFCGPGWCNDGWYSEWESASNYCGPNYTDPQTSPFSSSFACADACCRKHDECCAPGGTNKQQTSGCNKMIVECLAACNPLDISCLDALYVPIAAGTVWMAMDLVEEWCCGEPCD